MTTRIYVITDTKNYDAEQPAPSQRLVRAAHPSTALTHVVRTQFSVRVASQDDLARLLPIGVKVEDSAT